MPSTPSNKHLDSQRSSAAKTAKILNLSQDELVQSLRSLDPEFMFQAVSNAMQSFSQKMTNLENDPDPASQQKSVENTLELLNAIADFSPDCRSEMDDLYKAEAKAVIEDPVKLEKLKEVFNKLNDTESLQQMHVDLTNAMSQLAQQVTEDQKDYTQRLKDSLGNTPQRQEALDEHKHLTDKSISSKRDNALFDPVRVIGHLLAVLIHMEFIVPVEQDLYQHGFGFDGKQPDEFLDFNSKRFADSDVLPGSPMSPAASLPPGLKMGGNGF